MQVIKLTARVRPACRLDDSSAVIDGVEADEMLCTTFRRLQGFVSGRACRAGLPGLRPAQILRPACGQQQSRGRTGATAHCAAVRHRTARRGAEATAAPGVAPGIGDAGAGRTSRMAAGPPAYPRRRQRHGQGDRACHQALERYAGSKRAGRRAAIQSLFATAKLNGIDPARWLADTLEQLPTCPNSRIDSLLPFANATQL